MNTMNTPIAASRISTDQLQRERRTRYRGIVILVIITLLVAIALLLLAKPLNQWAAETEKTWVFVSTISTIIGGAVGLWFLWLKFFNAREFAPKIDITLTAGRVCLSETEANLHWCDVRMENTGTQSMVYHIDFTYLLYKDGITHPGDTLVSLVPYDYRRLPVIDAGGTTHDHYVVSVPFDKAQAVVFQVRVEGEAEHTDWWSHLTVSNAKEPA